MSYILVPHADDEFQAWSLIENSPANYKVFIYATRSEETGYCDPATYPSGYQSGKEKAANPVPTGRWSASCESARMNSLKAFFAQMSATDPTIPGSFGPQVTKGPFPANGTPICREDSLPPDGVCNSTGTSPRDKVDTTARVLVDTQGRGAIVMFNLGDGDLTEAEAVWAVKTVRDNRAALGLNTSLPNYNLLGTFANSTTYADGCKVYPHSDHRSVHLALYKTDFNMKYQSAATCAMDTDVTRSKTVTDASANAAWKYDVSGTVSTGAHNNNYGWLMNVNRSAENSNSVWHYPLSRTTQKDIFHTHQYFWTKFAH
ncbi:hypothetical protein MF406_17775 [Georgenia sp. TF02-10]|uniref:hypothetical protein n=1 Tax=Georgenia sp. TF02-10 TaxID=2917725 RepID=UPI001FA740D1|nr:hypothetical protein [Georgenia sp. TF02-10]UNX54698.1 hypothetical protein MF406_17775 [Georgenia sp. TF02-10]